ncbi:MAG: hypothetical protein JWP89_6915 [Schlesneria sp.]|nr:hypothetical protein [Schlesneria sp.]
MPVCPRTATYRRVLNQIARGAPLLLQIPWQVPDQPPQPADPLPLAGVSASQLGEQNLFEARSKIRIMAATDPDHRSQIRRRVDDDLAQFVARRLSIAGGAAVTVRGPATVDSRSTVAEQLTGLHGVHCYGSS